MFNKARLKLTFYYLLIIMVISVSFSAVIYKVDVNEVTRFSRLQRLRFETRLGFPTPVSLDPTLIQETEKRIVVTLISINATILVVSGITGYFLAGLTLAPIKEMVDEQNRFISDASHEIGTPLTSLKTAMEVYLRTQKPDLNEAKTLVTESIDEVNKLQSISASLLQLAQYEKPQNHTKFETISINKIIEEAVHKVTSLAKEKEIKIETKVKKINIEGNKYGLTDLFVILLDNAIKYSPAKTKVEITTKISKQEVKIFVKDHGIGIGKDDVEHVFDRFYRSDIARSKNKSSGYGLGLSIAKKIVDINHGTINIESTPGKGSTFIVSLPRKD